MTPTHSTAGDTRTALNHALEALAWHDGLAFEMDGMTVEDRINQALKQDISKGNISLTEPQIRVLLFVATFALAGDWINPTDRATLDRAVNALRAALKSAGGE